MITPEEPNEYLVSPGQRRFETPYKWDVVAAFGPRGTKGRPLWVVSRHRTRAEAVAERNRRNTELSAQCGEVQP